MQIDMSSPVCNLGDNSLLLARVAVGCVTAGGGVKG